jgi:anaerobic magnesium-protoporphyrin IX monomethyl ester cyclase
MKVTLVTPPSGFLLDARVFPSLGILKIGAVLRQAGHDVDHLDFSGVANYEEAARDYQGRADVFAFTATTPQLPAAIRLRSVLGGRAILGGPHATLVHAAAGKGNERAIQGLQHLVNCFGTVVAGDGEKAIFTALKRDRGVVDADDPRSELWQSSADFTASLWPDRSLIDMDSYHYLIDGRRATSAIFQLGCPFECGFCGGRLSPMLRRVRTRSTDSVIDEMMHLHEQYGLSAIQCYDDELNVNRGLIDLLRRIRETGIDWRLRGFVKAELFTEEQAEAMYAAGFRWLLCGFESAHPRILHNIQKVARLDDNTRMLRTAHAAGLKVKALMSMGHPGESEETIMATRDWLLEECPDDFDATVITLYPGTPYYDNSVCIGEPVYRYEFHGDALYSENVDFTREAAYYKGVPGQYHSFVWTDHLTREKLAELRDQVEAEVRERLGIPYPSAAAAVAFDHSMGMGLSERILRSGSQHRPEF